MDKYSDLSRIGEGSFGRVYKATEIATKKTVALKVITKVRLSIFLRLVITRFPLLRICFPFLRRFFPFTVYRILYK